MLIFSDKFNDFFVDLCKKKETKRIVSLFQNIIPSKDKEYQDIAAIYESYMAEYFNFKFILSDCENPDLLSMPIDLKNSFSLKRKDFINYKLEMLIPIDWPEQTEVVVKFNDRKESFRVQEKISLKCNLEELDEISFLTKNVRFNYKLIKRKINNVLVGIEDYLFLNNDRNKTLLQLTGKVKLNEVQIGKWRKYFEKLETYNNIIFTIAPSKERVLKKYLPLKIQCSFVQQLMEIPRSKSLLVDPVEVLTSHENVYSKTDTHWNYYGGFLALQESLKKFDIELPEEPFEFFSSLRNGDLGSKFSPNRLSETKYVTVKDFDLKECLEFSNYMSQDGLLAIYRNSKAKIRKKLILFGDSFSRYWYPFLVYLFESVIFVRTAGSIITQLVDEFSPDYIFVERAERFLYEPPSELSDFNQSEVFFRPPTKELLMNLEDFNRKTEIRIVDSYIEAYFSKYNL